MRTKTISFIVFSSIVFILLLPSSFAGLADQFQQAEKYQTEGRFTEAEAIYKQIIVTNPYSNNALAAQKNLTILYVKWGKGDLANQAYKKLLTDFPTDPNTPQAVTYIADAYRSKGNHSAALEIYKYVIATWPKDEHALWSQMDSAFSYACMGNTQACDAAMQKLCTVFAGHPNLPKAVLFIGDNWRKLSNYTKAKEVYEYVLTNNPDLESRLWSQMGLAISCAHLGDMDSASQAVESFLADFAKDQRVSIAACLTADQFRALGRYQEACALYQFVVDNWPNCEHAIWSQMGLAISNIHLGNNPPAQANIEKLIAGFASDRNFTQAIGLIAAEYHRQQNYRQADLIQQLALDALKKLPENKRSLWTCTAEIVSNIALGNDRNIQPQIDRLMTDFIEDPNLPKAVVLIAEGYYDRAFVEESLEREKTGRMMKQALQGPPTLNAPPKAKQYFQKAIEKWQMIIDHPPENRDITAQAYHFAATSFRRIGEYTKAIEYFQKVAYEYPEYEFADLALYITGRLLDSMARSDQIPQLESDAAIRQVYEDLVTRYPDSQAAKAAQSRLDQIRKQMSSQGAEK